MSDEQTVAANPVVPAPPQTEMNLAKPRPKFARLSRDRALAVKQMAARIKFLIVFFSNDGKSMRMQEIKRGLHAYRYVEFDDAINLLEQRRQISIRRVKCRSHVYRVTLKQTRTKLPDPFIFHRKKRKKRKKPPTTWFLERRHLMDAGQHENFGTIQPWSESAYWIEQEKTQTEPE
jgi:hypothetical protein